MNTKLKKVGEDDYLDSDGVSWDSVKDYIETKVLGFCGCGMPGIAREYVRMAMTLIQKLTELVYKDKMKYEDWKKECTEFFKSESAEYFMWYFLSNKYLTEHGTSIPGWLTDDGKKLLEDLNEIKQNEENETENR